MIKILKFLKLDIEMFYFNMINIIDKNKECLYFREQHEGTIIYRDHILKRLKIENENCEKTKIKYYNIITNNFTIN